LVVLDPDEKEALRKYEEATKTMLIDTISPSKQFSVLQSSPSSPLISQQAGAIKA